MTESDMDNDTVRLVIRPHGEMVGEFHTIDTKRFVVSVEYKGEGGYEHHLFPSTGWGPNPDKLKE